MELEPIRPADNASSCENENSSSENEESRPGDLPIEESQKMPSPQAEPHDVPCKVTSVRPRDVHHQMKSRTRPRDVQHQTKRVRPRSIKEVPKATCARPRCISSDDSADDNSPIISPEGICLESCIVSEEIQLEEGIFPAAFGK